MGYGTPPKGPPLWDLLYGTSSMGPPLCEVIRVTSVIRVIRIIRIIRVIRQWDPLYGTHYTGLSMGLPLWDPHQ